MFSDKFKNQTCDFAEETLSFLYGEFDPGDKERIETHVSACAVCAAEAQSFAVLRASINDWKVSEFDILKTPLNRFPHIEIPEAAKISLVESVRAYFSFSPWMAATASLVLLSIVAASALFIYNEPGNQIAEADMNRNSGMANPSPAENWFSPSENKEEIKQTAEVTEKLKTDPKTVDKKISEVATLTKTIAAKKNSNGDADKRIASIENKTVSLKSERQNKSVSRAAKKPTLADSSDADEDESLRLADIFDDISMR